MCGRHSSKLSFIMSSGVKGQSSRAPDDESASARSRAPPDAAPKLAKVILPEVKKKNWIRYGEHGRDSPKSQKTLEKQKATIRGAYRLQPNMCFSKKTSASAMSAPTRSRRVILGRRFTDSG